MADILDDLRDLHKQATTERSHYYAAGCTMRAITEIEKLRATVRCCILAMRSAQASKYPTNWTDMISGLENTVMDGQ